MAFAHFVPLLAFDGSFSRAWRFPRLVVFVFYFSRLWNWLYVFPRRVHVFVQQRHALCAGKQWFTSLLTFVLIGRM